MIGNCLSTVGILSLAFCNTIPLAKISALLLAIGSGIYKPAVVSTLYRVSITENRRFDFIYSVFYLIINIGAFLAPLVVGFLGDTGNPDDFRYGFSAAGAASSITTILLAVNYNKFKNNDLVYSNQPYSLCGVMSGELILYFIAGVVFWIGYELYPMFGGTTDSLTAQIIPMIALIVFGFLIIPLSLIRRFRSAFKIAVGLVVVATCLKLFPSFGLPVEFGLILFAAAEMLVAPIIMSQIIQSSSPRFTGTVIAGFMAMTLLTNKLAGTMSQSPTVDQSRIIWTIGSLCIVFATGFLVLDHFRKKEEKLSVQ